MTPLFTCDVTDFVFALADVSTFFAAAGTADFTAAALPLALAAALATAFLTGAAALLADFAADFAADLAAAGALAAALVAVLAVDFTADLAELAALAADLATALVAAFAGAAFADGFLAAAGLEVFAGAGFFAGAAVLVAAFEAAGLAAGFLAVAFVAPVAALAPVLALPDFTTAAFLTMTYPFSSFASIRAKHNEYKVVPWFSTDLTAKLQSARSTALSGKSLWSSSARPNWYKRSAASSSPRFFSRLKAFPAAKFMRWVAEESVS
ncbi:hypothetical protein [Mesorhizobium sp. NBSH29]|uniref:hypothetical protein n=1 Tax=Mesorhizobium sp. NBSH29 TaxID=2654249 RepID=UPI001AED9C9B|nr:hypothetical protein [Mesorhizobium sp. NBSH29]